MRVSAIAGAMVFGLSGCASTSGLEMEMSRMRRDLASIRENLSDTRRQVERLEGQVTLLSLGKQDAKEPVAVASAKPSPSTPRSAPVKRVQGPQRILPVVRLGGQAQVDPAQEGTTWQDPGALDDGSPPVMIKLGPSASSPPQLPVDHDVLKKPDPVLSTSAKPVRRTKSREQIREEYRDALAKFREDNAPQEALTQFRAFIEAYPRSRLTDNAMFWAGRCLYTLARYKEAIEQFEGLFTQHPQSPKIPHAMVTQGESWLALGSKDRGLAVLKRVINDYPTTDAARKAKTRLDQERGQ